MGSPYADLGRPPLSQDALRRALARTIWQDVRVVATSASTNSDVAEAAREGAPEGLVVAAEAQTAGRGRLGRTWTAPARAGLTFSMLLRPATPAETWNLLPLLAGLSLVEAVRGVAHLGAVLKWPNDLLDPAGRKLAGILTESVHGSVVLGIGLNVTTRAEELPSDAASSLELSGATVTDRAPILAEVLRAFERRYLAWQDSGGAPASVVPAYRDVCATVGGDVRVELPGDRRLEGLATAIDDSGRLVVRTEDGESHLVGAGDVVHVRSRR